GLAGHDRDHRVEIGDRDDDEVEPRRRGDVLQVVEEAVQDRHHAVRTLVGGCQISFGVAAHVRQDHAMHLAELNIARLTNPIDHPATADFVAGLDPINALAEASPGFVWRLQTDDGDATALRPHPDPEVIVNLTVWESAEALHDFVFKTGHTGF